MAVGPTCLIAAWLTASMAAMATTTIIFLYMSLCCGADGSGESALLTGLLFAGRGKGSKLQEMITTVLNVNKVAM